MKTGIRGSIGRLFVVVSAVGGLSLTVAAQQPQPLPRSQTRPAEQTRPPQEQPEPPTDAGKFRFRSSVELINVSATVTDQTERFVSGLRKEDFKLYEDGKLQSITHFSDERVPVSLGIVLDVSGSMEGEKFRSAQDAIDRFVTELLGPEDEFFLYTFSDDVRLVQGWTRNRQDIRRALERVYPRGGTAMYDAVAEAIPLAQSGRNRKKALVVISDGNDRNSSTSARELKSLIRETEVLIYAIAIDGNAPSYTPTIRTRPRTPSWPIPGRTPPQWPGQPRQPGGRLPRPGTPPWGGGGGGGTSSGGPVDEGVNAGALHDLTDDSGGRTELVRDGRDLGPATASIADELSKQYSLAYSPAAAKDGRWHTITVEVTNRDYLVRARRGYIATP